MGVSSLMIPRKYQSASISAFDIAGFFKLLRKSAEVAALKTQIEPVLINEKAVPFVEQQISFSFILTKDPEQFSAITVDYCDL